MRWLRTGISWLVDQAIEHWAAIFTTVFGGGGMTYLASISSWLAPYGPVAWGAIGIMTIFILSTSFFLISFSRKGIRRKYTRAELTHITGQKFQNTTVILDGHLYDECLFQDVTFEYINNSKMGGNMILKTDNSVIVTTVDFLKGIGMLKQEFVDSWQHLPKKSPEKQ